MRQGLINLQANNQLLLGLSGLQSVWRDHRVDQVAVGTGLPQLAIVGLAVP